MTKKTVLRIADWLLWTLLALLPVIVYLFEFIAVSGMTTAPTVTAFADVVSRFVAPGSDNVIYTLLSSVFGSSDIAIGKLTTPLLQYFTYFVVVELVHFVVDFALFIPRWALRIMDKASEVVQ